MQQPTLNRESRDPWSSLRDLPHISHPYVDGDLSSFDAEAVLHRFKGDLNEGVEYQDIERQLHIRAEPNDVGLSNALDSDPSKRTSEAHKHGGMYHTVPQQESRLSKSPKLSTPREQQLSKQPSQRSHKSQTHVAAVPPKKTRDCRRKLQGRIDSQGSRPNGAAQSTRKRSRRGLKRALSDEGDNDTLKTPAARQISPPPQQPISGAIQMFTAGTSIDTLQNQVFKCGRGHHNEPGNILFREFLLSYAPTYKKLKKGEKQKWRKHLLLELCRINFRFEEEVKGKWKAKDPELLDGLISHIFRNKNFNKLWADYTKSEQQGKEAKKRQG